MAILKIVLNQEQKGEFYVYLEDDGDFLVRSEDLKKMGFSETRGRKSVIEGEEYVSLRSVAGVNVALDEKKLALELIVNPELLGKKILELRYPRQTNVYYPKDISGFLNYNLTYFGGDSFAYEKTLLTNELGFRIGDFLLLTDSSYTHQKGEGGQFVRLMSNITYDRRDDLTRAVVGDFFASSGELGSTVNMGGISFSKTYNIDPYFIRYPEMSFSGLASLPSQLEIYRDGVLIKKDVIQPGGFNLKDIPTYVGAGLVDVVLKDPFGREQRISLPYYFTDTLLKKGLHEYSYNLGFSREDFGTVSNHYRDLMFLGFHRYGIDDSLTAGIRAEASKRVLNLGLTSTYLFPGRLGIISASTAWSDSKEGGGGVSGSVSYLYQGRTFSFNLLFRGFTRDYSNIVIETTKDREKYEASVGGSLFSSTLGSFSLGFSATKQYVGLDAKSVLATYSRKITNRSNLIASFRRDIENRITDFTISFNYFFNHGITASSKYEGTNGNSSEQIQVVKNLPLGEGFGGRASFEANQTESRNSNNYDLQLQYNSKYGQYAGEFVGTDGRNAYSLTAAGGFVLVKDTFGFGRPVEDSFAVVKVGDLKGVRVYLSSQEIDRTGSSGKVLVPNLGSYYENQISINPKDIPIEYNITEVMKYVSPPLRSGSYIEFAATKIQSFFGTLKIKVDQEVKPVEYVEFKLAVDGKELESPTGKGGEFYLENVKPGKYRGEFEYLKKTYSFDIVIPKSEEVLIDLGEIVCE